MKQEEFERLEDYQDMIFIGENMQNAVSNITFDKKGVVIVTGEASNAKSYDDPYYYFQLAMMYVAMKTSHEKSEEDQIRMLVDGKNKHIQHAEKIKRNMEDFPTCKKYNFDSFINQYNGLIEIAQANLDTKLLSSQVAANESSIQTNELSKITNIYVALFTGIAGLYYISELLKNYIPLNTPNRTIVIYVFLLVAMAVGIFGYLKMRRVLRRKS